MDDVEDPPEVEDQIENLGGGGEEEEVEEESMYLPSRWKDRAYSVFRQVICYCSVISFPCQYIAFEYLGDVIQRQNKPFYYTVMIHHIGGSIGYICCAIVWCIMGSKCAVVASNILNLLLAAMTCINYDKTDSFRYTIYIVGFVHDFSKMSSFVYTAEVMDNTFRAFFVGFYFFIHRWMTWKYEEIHVRKLAGLHRLALVLGVGSTLWSVFVPQSPFWVASKGDPEKARSIFRWLRAGDSDDAECELMLEKAQWSVRDLAKKLMSSTFVMCITFCVILDFCFYSGCDLLQVFAHDYYIPKKSEGIKKILYRKVKLPFDVLANKFYTFFMVQLDDSLYAAHGTLVFQVLCFVLRRKILYSSGILFTLLLAVPLATLADFDELIKILPFCETAEDMGRLQFISLWPLEIFPAILRPVGVTISYVFYNLFHVWRLKTFARARREYLLTNEAGAYKYVYLPFEWVYWNYSISIIAIPFLLIYIPETMGMNLYELEEVKLPFTGASSQLDSTEETVEEEQVAELLN